MSFMDLMRGFGWVPVGLLAAGVIVVNVVAWIWVVLVLIKVCGGY